MPLVAPCMTVNVPAPAFTVRVMSVAASLRRTAPRSETVTARPAVSAVMAEGANDDEEAVAAVPKPDTSDEEMASAVLTAAALAAVRMVLPMVDASLMVVELTDCRAEAAKRPWAAVAKAVVACKAADPRPDTSEVLMARTVFAAAALAAVISDRPVGVESVKDDELTVCRAEAANTPWAAVAKAEEACVAALPNPEMSEVDRDSNVLTAAALAAVRTERPVAVASVMLDELTVADPVSTALRVPSTVMLRLAPTLIPPSRVVVAGFRVALADNAVASVEALTLVPAGMRVVPSLMEKVL